MPTSRTKKKRTKGVKKTRKSKNLFSNKFKKKIKRALILATIAIFSLTFLGGFGVYNYLKQGLTFAENSGSKSLTESMFPSFIFGVVEDGGEEVLILKSLKMIILDVDSSRAFIYEIPTNTIVDVPGKFTNEEISKVLALGSLENPDKEGQVDMLLRSVFKLFAFKTDKYLIVTPEYEQTMENFIDSGSLLPMMNKDMITQAQNSFFLNIDIKEFYYLSGILKEIPSERVMKIQLTTRHVENPEIVDSEIRELTINSPLNEERKNIAVLNGTDTPGMASFVSRTIQNYGGRIVAVNNADQKYNLSTIIAEDPNSDTVNLLSHLFGIESIAIKDSSTEVGDTSTLSRSDVVVIIGFDISSEL